VPGEAPPAVERALRLVDAAARATDAYGRPDLSERLARARVRLTDPDIETLVVGEFKKGKSTLVNALLNIPLCPASDEVATVVPTVVRHGAEPSAEVVTEGLAAPDGGGDGGSAPERFAIPLDEIPAWTSELGNEDNVRGVRAVEIRVPRKLLDSGLRLVDTPGVGGLRSVHGAATMAALGAADVVVFVTDASQELTAVEVATLRAAAERAPLVVCVVTKTDLYPSWRRIVDLDRARLQSEGLDGITVVPVSSTLRQRALGEGSRELNEESGYPVLLHFLQERVIVGAQHLAARVAVSDVLFVTNQLEGTFQAELEVLVDPARAEPVLHELERAKARAEGLKTRSARWQQTLNDGSVDLAAEVDHDLRRRLRDVVAWAEGVVDEHDPLDIWDSFDPVFRQQVAADVAANADLLRAAAGALAAKVADHFAIDETAVVHPVETRVAPVADPGLELELERVGRGANMLSAVRGSYSGILMFGMVGQLLGMTLVNPLTAVIGIGMGRKALRDERKRQLAVRRQQMKQVIRKYVDDVSFAAGKSSRDAVRQVQRDLRDEFTERADQLQRSVREALVATEAAARQTVETAAVRQRDVQAELDRIAVVRRAADDLARGLMAGRPR
jgi:GTPase SAR1 family protein